MSNKIKKSNYFKLFYITFIISIVIPENFVNSTQAGDEISNWADIFGQELWNLAQNMTKSDQIKAKYGQYNARVEEKDGNELIASIAENVGRMLQKKVDAVVNILQVAEEIIKDYEFNETEAENLTYYSSKYSEVFGEKSNLIEFVMGEEEQNALGEVINSTTDMYDNMTLNQDSHFFNMSVNTNHSSVHVPSNVYTKSDDALESIEWSKGLDETFVNNYKADPALSWQYFCSETGILRHYPGMRWTHQMDEEEEQKEEEGDDVDVYDCRKRSWYIEAATCSKDVIIMVDSSGSMTGFRKYLARLTVQKIMDTFSNNDLINIYNYSAGIQELVPCFGDDLVQATPENIEIFNEAMKLLQPEGYANLTYLSEAFTKAFQILERYRIERRCSESISGCNQAIMVITDGIAEDLSEVMETFNRINEGNKTKVPVRIFTYLLGREVSNVETIECLAKTNRGSYAHIKTLDEVSEDVLKYVNVIATPLILQGEEHPPTWTHAFADEFNKKRLMIAVGVPVFDKRAHNENDTRENKLLGVAGTDVPVNEIDELALPYKLGVNAYPIIVSNNGYVLLHPDLRPMFNGTLKDNYNSIDLTEVEQINDNRGHRNPGETLILLRESLVNATTVGNMLNIPVCFHYDEMRRVALTEQDYYYAPLPNTPFTLGIVIPSTYGKTWFKVGDEVKRNIILNINMTEYFVDKNWKVHPEWVYCKYHYLEEHDDYPTRESELLHFLVKLNDIEFKWAKQYMDNVTKLDVDAYYCNKELVQLLIFDAKITNTSYGQWEYESEEAKELIKSYEAPLRFVATMSGLTRWQFIEGEEVEVEDDIEFGDEHSTAIDEIWYKSAILQFNIDQFSFVYFVPHQEDIKPKENIQVTASHAIFRQDGGLLAPGCVVGFQFSMEAMFERFMNITSTTKCEDCIDTCDSSELDCYIVDNNGYIIISENKNDVGMFFGEVEGAIMEGMVAAEIFNNYTIYDLQGLCYKEVLVSNNSKNINPYRILLWWINYIVTEILWYFSRIIYWVKAELSEIEEEGEHKEQGSTEGTITSTTQMPIKSKGKKDADEEYWAHANDPKWETVEYPCDKQSTLYILNQTKIMKGSGFNAEGPVICSKPYYLKHVPHSNLLLIAVKGLYPTCPKILSTEPEIIEQENLACNKRYLNELTRRRLEECFTEHEDEIDIDLTCGSEAQHLKLFAIIFAFLMNFYV